MKKITAYTLLFFICSWSTAQEVPSQLSLNQAIDWGMDFNRTLQRADLELQKAHKEKWRTLAIGFPQINANFQYQNFIEQPVSLIPAQFFGGEEGEFAEVVFGTQQTALGAVELTQLLFDGTYIVGVQGIRHYIENAESILEKTQLEIRRAIVTAYINVLVAQENIRILKDNARVIGTNITETEQLYSNGLTEEENVEQLRLTKAQLTTQINYATKAHLLTKNVLKLLLGIALENEIALTDQLDALTVQHMLTDDPNATYNNNIDIRLAEQNIITEKLLVKYEKAKGLPSISAFINGAYAGNSDTFTFTDRDQKWFGSSAFGLQMRVPIFSSLGRTAGTQKAKLKLQQAETQLIETRSQVFVQWENAQNNFALAKDNYNTAKESLKLAERIEAKNRTKFFEGLSGSFELRQAQMQLYQAQQNVVQSMRQVILDKTELTIIANSVE